MLFLKVTTALTLLAVACVGLPQAPPPPTAVTEAPSMAARESSRRISRGAEQFALEMFGKISDVLHMHKIRRDVMISPFAIWSLLLLLTEGADGATLQQLRTSLHIEDDQVALRRAFREVQRYLKIKTETVEVASLQTLFTDINQPVNREFENTIERDYGSLLTAVNFHDPNATYHLINAEVREATRGLIPFTVLPQDLQDANLFMLSSLFFKGQWKKPFNRSLTRTDIFYDEEDKPFGEVEMMMQVANFNYTGLNELEGHVLELPYGKEDRLSMLIILPKRGVSVNKVVHNLQQLGTAPIFERLAANSVGFEDDEVEVFLPKFSTASDFSLKSVLQDLGLADIFDPNMANLSKMAANLFVSNIIHTTKIIVDEEGTTAAAATAAVLANKATPPKFYLNRPFLYLIVEKSTNLILFTGQVTNPANVK